MICFYEFLTFSANIYLFKFNNRNTRKRWEICQKLIIKAPERCHSGVFFVNFEYILRLFLVFLLVTLSMHLFAWLLYNFFLWSYVSYFCTMICKKPKITNDLESDVRMDLPSQYEQLATKYPARHWIVDWTREKHQSHVWDLITVNNKDTRITSWEEFEINPSLKSTFKPTNFIEILMKLSKISGVNNSTNGSLLFSFWNPCVTSTFENI